MKKGLIGKKIGMTQIFDEAGNVIPVTVVEAGPCTVTQIKTVENDGYQAVQVGFGDVKVSRVNKPMKGHFERKHLRNSVSTASTVLRLVTFSRLTHLRLAKSLMLREQARVTEQQAQSSVGTSQDSE